MLCVLALAVMADGFLVMGDYRMGIVRNTYTYTVTLRLM